MPRNHGQERVEQSSKIGCGASFPGSVANSLWEQDNMMKKLSLFLLTAIVLLVLSPLPSEAQEIEDFHEIMRFGQPPLNGVAWQADGTLAIDDGDYIRIFSDTFEEITEFALPGAMRATTWSPNSLRMLRYWGGDDVEIYNPETEQMVELEFSEDWYFYSSSWSPGDEYIAAINENRLAIWDTTTGERVETINHRSNISTAAWSPDGMYIATGTVGGDIIIWDAETFEQASISHIDFFQAEEINWSPDSTYLAINRVWEQGIIIWNIATMEQMAYLTGFDEIISDMEWNFDGTLLAIRNGLTIHIWDTVTWEQVNSLNGHTDRILMYDWHPSDNRLASVSADNTVRIWDTTSSEQLAIFENYTHGYGIAWSSNNTQIAVLDNLKRVLTWDVVTGELLSVSEPFEFDSSNVMLVWYPNDTPLIISMPLHSETRRERYIRFWDVESHEMIADLTVLGQIRTIAWSRDWTTFATLQRTEAGRNNLIYSIHIWDTSTWQEQVIWEHSSEEARNSENPPEPNFSINDIALNPDGSQIALAQYWYGGDVEIIDATTGETVQILGSDEIDEAVEDIEWSPLGTQIIVTLGLPEYATTGQIMWDVATGEHMRSPYGDVMAWHPDGVLLATYNSSDDPFGNPSQLESYALVISEPGVRSIKLIGHTDYIDTLFWSPDGTMLASGSADGTIRIWGE
jgi:WD40 repeat protein